MLMVSRHAHYDSENLSALRLLDKASNNLKMTPVDSGKVEQHPQQDTVRSWVTNESDSGSVAGSQRIVRVSRHSHRHAGLILVSVRMPLLAVMAVSGKRNREHPLGGCSARSLPLQPLA